jgi:acyl-CoA-binding protein
MPLAEDFEAAVARSRSLPNQSNENLLRLYALYKQGTAGDVSGSRPGLFDLKGRAKYDAWATLKGKAQDTAKQEYIALVDKLGGR